MSWECGFEALRAKWPAGWPPLPEKHPTTGESVVSAVAEFRSPSQVVSWLGPGGPPGWWVYDEDGNEVRRKSREEYAADLARWRAAEAEFRRTGGERVVRAGPDTCELKIRTARGSTATMVCGTGRGSEWHLLEWTSVGRTA